MEEKTAFVKEKSSGRIRKRRLIVIDTLGKVKEYAINSFENPVIRFGRAEEKNDIVLASPIVSGTHGALKVDGNHLLFADLNSSNGTIVDADGYRQFVCGNRQYIRLKGGDMLRIQAPEGMEEHSVLILYETAGTRGNWQRFPLLAHETKVGRDEGNDIVISHPAISRFHARIRKAEDGFRLKDCNSSNGVFVNGIRIQSEMLLHEKDVIRIATHTLIYTNGQIFYKNSVQGTNIEVEDVNKFVGSKRKKILDRVSLTIESNEFVAIVGGSGAGKTTLMNAISCFDKKFEGSVSFNGTDMKAHFSELKDMIGYVPQEDIIYDNLTLKKMLTYTAKLKMPGDTSREEINHRIQQVLSMVDLTDHQNTYIRKLSGGQKKRASIAVELLADPSVFFLDEPTSGLDPGTEQKLMITLNKLSKSQGKTIVMVTHTTQSLQLCDKVIFMGRGGRLCFCGTTDKAKAFFDTDDLVDIYNMITEEPEYWSDQYRAYTAQENARRDSTGRGIRRKRSSERGIDQRRGKATISQLPVLISRYITLVRNDTQRLLMLLLQPVGVAFLLSLVANDQVFQTYDDTKSILFSLSCAAIWIGLFNSIQEICKERAILKREYMGNLRLSYYTASKFLVQTLLGAIQALLMTAVFIVMVGSPDEGVLFSQVFFEMFLTIWFTIEASMAIGFVASSLVRNADRAMTIAPFVLIVQLLFSGILFVLSGAGEYISYVTVSKWSVEALGSTSHLNDLPTKLQGMMPSAEHVAEEIFESSAGHLFLTWGILVGMMLICAVICTILLRRVAKDSR